MTDETLDTFDEGTYTEGESGLDTFEDGSYTNEEETSTNEETTSSQKREEVDNDSQVAQLDEKEEKRTEDKEEKTKEGDKEAKGDDSERKDAEADKDTAKAETPTPTGKTVKAFQDGKRYEIPQDAEIKVKIDGKNVKVPMQELINNYSGKESWDKKFSELSEERNQYKQERDQYDQEKNYIQEVLQETRGLAVKALQGEVNPLDFVNNLLDQMNLNSYDFHRALRESMSEEISLYNEMTEIEREAFELKQKTDYLERKQETSARSLADQQAQEELIQRVDQLRQTHGVSEEQYVAAFNDLSELGHKDLTADQIVRYAAMVEPTTRAEQLVKPYEDQLDDDQFDTLVVDIAQQLFKDRDLTDEQVKRFLAEEFMVEDILNDLEEKGIKDVPKKNSYHRYQDDTAGYETFDDFDY